MNLFSNGISVNPLNSIVPHSCTQECKMLHIKLSLALKKNKSYSTGVAYLLKIVFYLWMRLLCVLRKNTECWKMFASFVPYCLFWLNISMILVHCWKLCQKIHDSCILFARGHKRFRSKAFRLLETKISLKLFIRLLFICIYEYKKKKWSGCLWFVKFGAQ